MNTTNAPPDEVVITLPPNGRWGTTWRAVPTSGHVAYVALGRSGDVLYVGQSSRPRERLQEHAKSGYPWGRSAVRFVIFPLSSQVDALLAEHRLIEELRPRFNKQRGQLGRVRALLEAEYAAVTA